MVMGILIVTVPDYTKEECYVNQIEWLLAKITYREGDYCLHLYIHPNRKIEDILAVSFIFVDNSKPVPGTEFKLPEVKVLEGRTSLQCEPCPVVLPSKINP